MTGEGAAAVVEHRAQQQLPQCPGAAAVTGQQGEGRGEPAAGALPADDDAVRVDVQFGRVPGRPDESGVAVLQRFRVLRPRRQPVLDRDDGQFQRERPLAKNPRKHGPRVAHDHRAPVHVVQQRQRPDEPGRPCAHERDVRPARRPRHPELRHLETAVGAKLLGRRPGPGRGIPFLPGLQIARGERLPGLLAQGGHRDAQLGVQGGTAFAAGTAPDSDGAPRTLMPQPPVGQRDTARRPRRNSSPPPQACTRGVVAWDPYGVANHTIGATDRRTPCSVKASGLSAARSAEAAVHEGRLRGDGDTGCLIRRGRTDRPGVGFAQHVRDGGRST